MSQNKDFTPLELRVMELQILGKSTKQIADKLFMGESTIRKQINSIKHKSEGYVPSPPTILDFILNHGFKIVMILSFIGLGFSIFGVKKDSQPTFSAQVDNLDIMSKNIGEFQKFLAEQKQTLIAEQSALNELKQEKKTLEPLVASDRKIVQSLFIQQEKRQNEKVWYERAFGFFIGILSSLSATYLFMKITKRKTE